MVKFVRVYRVIMTSERKKLGNFCDEIPWVMLIVDGILIS